MTDNIELFAEEVAETMKNVGWQIRGVEINDSQDGTSKIVIKMRANISSKSTNGEVPYETVEDMLESIGDEYGVDVIEYGVFEKGMMATIEAYVEQ